MPVRITNNARSLLAVSISASDTQVRVRVGHGARFPTLGGDEWFPLVLEDDQGNIEITRCTARAGDVLVVRRGQDGTQARAFSAGALVSLRLTSPAIREIFGLDQDEPPPIDDPDLSAPRGLIFNGLIVNAYHDEEGRQGYFHPYSGTSEGQFLFIGACYQAAQVMQDYLDEVGTPEPMTITGLLPAAWAKSPYESYLTINNAVGYTNLEKIDGDELPEGAQLYIDQSTQRIVIKWPAFEDVEVGDVFNGDFENASEGWNLPQGWAVVPVSPSDNGFGLYVLRHTGNTLSRVESDVYVPCPPAGTTFPLRLMVQQGASDAGKAGAGVGIRFYGPAPDYEYIETQLGNQVWSGSNAQWHPSVLNVRVPEGAAFMRPIIDGGHIRQGSKPLWVDNVTWTVPSFVGVELDRSYCFTLKVTDSLDREATWSGCVLVSGLPRTIYATGFTSPNTYFAKWERGAETWGESTQVTPGGSVSLWSPGGGLLFRGGSIRSTDGGDTWQEIPVTVPEGGPATSAIGTPGLRTTTGTLLFTTASSGYSILRSTDNGATIEAVPRTTSSTGGNSSQVLMMDKDGIPLRVTAISVLQTLDDGFTWTVRGERPDAGGFNANTTNFTYGRQNEILAFANGTDGIAVSVDNGVNWAFVSSPSGTARFVLFHNGRWYCATNDGVYWAEHPAGEWHASELPDGWPGPSSPNLLAPYAEGVIVGTSAPSETSLIWSPDGEVFEHFPKPEPAQRVVSSLVATQD